MIKIVCRWYLYILHFHNLQIYIFRKNIILLDLFTVISIQTRCVSMLQKIENNIWHYIVSYCDFIILLVIKLDRHTYIIDN